MVERRLPHGAGNVSLVVIVWTESDKKVVPWNVVGSAS